MNYNGIGSHHSFIFSLLARNLINCSTNSFNHRLSDFLLVFRGPFVKQFYYYEISIVNILV